MGCSKQYSPTTGEGLQLAPGCRMTFPTHPHAFSWVDSSEYGNDEKNAATTVVLAFEDFIT